MGQGQDPSNPIAGPRSGSRHLQSLLRRHLHNDRLIIQNQHSPHITDCATGCSPSGTARQGETPTVAASIRLFIVFPGTSVPATQVAPGRASDQSSMNSRAWTLAECYTASPWKSRSLNMRAHKQYTSPSCLCSYGLKMYNKQEKESLNASNK
jgi:hypothetical protein